MSHITQTTTEVKFENEQTLKSALELVKNQFVGLTYEQSSNGEIIAIRHAAIDDPVRSYHPEGNMRITRKNDGTWEISGDTWRCHDEYNAVVDALEMGYNQAIAQEWSDLNCFTTEESTDENKQRILIARKW